MSWLCRDCLTDMPNLIETAAGMLLDLGFVLVQFLLKLDGEEVTGFFLSNSGITVPPLNRTNEVIETAQDNSTFNSITVEYVEPETDGEDAEDIAEEDGGDITEEDESESVVFLLQEVSSTKTFILTEDIGEDLVNGVSGFEYISEGDLTDLVNQIQLDEDICKCPNCKEKDGLLRHQSFVSKTAQQLLLGIHQLVKPFLSWAGQPSTCLYLVRRDWEQVDGVRCLVLQQVGTGKLLICQQHFELEVEEVEEFAMKLEETLSKTEEDPLACNGLHCRLKKATLVALGNFPTFDLDRLQLERRRLGVWECEGSEAAECAVCLETLKAGELVAELVCKHVFHGTCLSRWVGEGHFSCPICRAEVQEI